MEKERRLSVDLLRVLASLAIVVIHVTSQSYFRIEEIGYRNWLLGAGLGWMMMWGTGNFLMISGGLLLGSKKNKVKEFYKRRVVRLAIPLLVWNVIYFFFSIYANGRDWGVKDFLNNLWTKGNYYHLYFLNVMIGLYAINPLLKRWINKEWLDYLVPILSILGMGYLYGISFWGWGKLESIFTWFLPYLGYYLGGYWLLNKRESKRKIWWLLGAGVILIINIAITRKLVFVMETHEMDTILMNRLSLGVVVAAMMIYRAVTSIKNEVLEKYKKLILWLSEMSMGIYLIHPLWVEFFKLNKNWMDLMKVNYGIWLLAYILGVTSLTIGSSCLIKKIPGLSKII